MRRANRRDPGEKPIVEALRAIGARVSSWGTDGAPDLVVGWRGRVFLLEIKEPIGPEGGTSKRGQHLTPAQVRFHREWFGYVDVVRSVDEALAVLRSKP